MIALRRTIERGVRHPLFGPLCLLLLALLLAFTVLHGAHDQLQESGEFVVCLAIVITVLLSLVVARLPALRVVFLPVSRGPPCQLPLPPVSPPARRTAPVPLRL